MKTLSYQGLLALVFFISAKYVAAQATRAKEANWEDVCKRATATQFVAPASASAQGYDSLRDCNSVSLYYGFKGAPDKRSALACAYYERAHPRPDTGDPFYGVGVLTMLYANGAGVSRDYGLAIRFACENTWAASAEMEGRIGHLEYLRDSHARATNFDLCDDATSGLMEGACAEIDDELAERKRSEKLKDLAVGWSPEVRHSFELLQQAEKAYAEARSGNEIDLSGTGRGAFSIIAQAKVHDEFLANLGRFAKGEVPKASEIDYKSADATLNATYRQLIAEKGKENKDEPQIGGTVQVSGIRETERVWISSEMPGLPLRWWRIRTSARRRLKF